jgi:GTPase SAR1 family protein
MKLLYLNGFTDEERVTWKNTVHNNCFNCMQTILREGDRLNVKIKSKKNKAIAKRVIDDDEYFTGEITKKIADDFASLWADAGVLASFERRAEYQLPDCAEYYLANVARLGSDGYTPTPDDILRARIKTTGIIETEWTLEGTVFKMVDVGGQRSERKKWMHCFSDVTAVLFCVALSEYDLKLYEDNTTNRMHESLKLFKEICNSKWFVETNMILFLNKSDLFKDKITKVPLGVCFAGYKGKADYDTAIEFITDEFCKCNEQDHKAIYPHVTNATDTGNVRHVFDAVKDIVLRQALDSSGLAM